MELGDIVSRAWSKVGKEIGHMGTMETVNNGYLWDRVGDRSHHSGTLTNMAREIGLTRTEDDVQQKRGQLHIEELSMANHASDEVKDEDNESVKARVEEAISEQGPHEDHAFPKYEQVAGTHQVLGVDTDHGHERGDGSFMS